MTSCCKPVQPRKAKLIASSSPGSSGHFFKVNIMTKTVEGIQKQSPAEEIRRENLYHTKLQCLAEVLSKRSLLDERGAVQDAKAINAAFDKITF